MFANYLHQLWAVNLEVCLIENSNCQAYILQISTGNHQIFIGFQKNLEWTFFQMNEVENVGKLFLVDMNEF